MPSYGSYIPGYDQGSNPLAGYSMKNRVIKYESAPVEPQPTTTTYQDAILRQQAGQTAPVPDPVPVTESVAEPDELPPAQGSDYKDQILRDQEKVEDEIQEDPDDYKDQIVRDQEKLDQAADAEKAAGEPVDGGLALIGLGAILYVGSMLLG